MSQLDREGLISQSNFLFPDNTTREITPADLRTFNTDVADSLTITGSNVISASYADASGFASSSDWSGINNIPSGIISGSSQLPSGTVSGSSQIIAEDTTGTFPGSRIDGAVALATSASHAEHADNATEIFVNVKNTSGFDILKGTAVHATGVTGDKINITTASYDDANLMPAIGVAQTDISNNAVGEVILSGRLINTDTSGLIEGATVYVNGGGSLTATKPTGSALIQNIGTAVKINATEGEILVLGSGRTNDLPNIQEGYYWVGDANGVPQPQLSSSVDVGVTSVIAGTNISVDQSTGDVTISAPSGIVSGSDQLTSSLDTRYEERGSGIVSSSAQITPLLPTGTVSGSYVSSIIAGTNVSIDQGTGDVTISASGTAIDTGSFATTGSNTFVAGQTISAGNLEFSGTGQIISIGNGTVDANEVSTANLLVDSVEVNNATQIAIKSQVSASADITGSNVNLDGGLFIQTSNNDTYPIEALNGNNSGISIYSKNDEDGSGTAVQVQGLASFNKGASINVSAVTQTPLLVQDGASERLKVLGQTEAGSTGINVYVNGVLGTGGEIKPGDNIDMSGTSGKIINNPNGSIESGEVATPLLLVDTIEPNTGADVTLQTGVIVSGSTKTETQVLSIASTTASVDFSQTDMFELTLAAGVDTHLTNANVGKGQTINILVKQNSGGSGTLSFDTEFLQPSGSSYTATPTANAEDILTLVTFNDTTKIYVAAVNKLQ